MRELIDLVWTAVLFLVCEYIILRMRMSVEKWSDAILGEIRTRDGHMLQQLVIVDDRVATLTRRLDDQLRRMMQQLVIADDRVATLTRRLDEQLRRIHALSLVVIELKGDVQILLPPKHVASPGSD